jgi:hypothetical protein
MADHGGRELLCKDASWSDEEKEERGEHHMHGVLLVCVCVWRERERERKGERGKREGNRHSLFSTLEISHLSDCMRNEKIGLRLCLRENDKENRKRQKKWRETDASNGGRLDGQAGLDGRMA